MKKEFEEIKAKKLPLSKWDLIILGVVIVLVIALVAVMFSMNATPKVCKIYRDGKCVKIVNLSDIGNATGLDGEQSISRIFEFNGVRIIVYKDGAEIIHANCYDEACVKSEKITKKGECIECVPSCIAVTLE